MHRHLVLLITASLLLVSWLIKYYGYLRTWIAQLCSQPSIAKRKRKNKSRPCPCLPKDPNDHCVRLPCPANIAYLSVSLVSRHDFAGVVLSRWQLHHQYHYPLRIRNWIYGFRQEWGDMACAGCWMAMQDIENINSPYGAEMCCKVSMLERKAA